MGDLRTVRWTRNGTDRLYVMQSDGISLGWLDLATGERHLVHAALHREMESALAAYVRDLPGLLAAVAPPDHDPAAAAVTAGEELHDHPRTGAWWRDGWR